MICIESDCTWIWPSSHAPHTSPQRYIVKIKYLTALPWAAISLHMCCIATIIETAGVGLINSWLCVVLSPNIKPGAVQELCKYLRTCSWYVLDIGSKCSRISHDTVCTCSAHCSVWFVQATVCKTSLPYKEFWLCKCCYVVSQHLEQWHVTGTHIMPVRDQRH